MKKFLTILCSIPLITTAQITINQASFTGWQGGADTIRVIDSATAAGLSFPAGNNKTWNMGSKSYTTTNYVIDYDNPASSPSFPNATYKFTTGASVAGLVDFSGEGWGGISSSALNIYGFHTERQAVWLGAFTPTPTDSIVFPIQDIVYTTPEKILQFPASGSGSWNSSYVATVNFVLSIFPFYNNDPGYVVRYTQITNQITGWGKMIVPNPNGDSAVADVLQITKHANYIDSFYINGQPIPDLQLNQLGLGQGMETDVFSVAYYRAGEVTPFVEIFYTDGSYTTITEINVHTQRLVPTSVNQISWNNAEIYPNPVTNGQLNIRLKNNSTGVYEYQMMNMIGQITQSGQLRFVNGAATLNMEHPTPGLFYLFIQDDQGVKNAASFMID